MNSPANREREIFNLALERPTAAERIAYLDGACGEDRELRARVERLLRSHDQAGGFLPEDDPQLPAGAPATLLVSTSSMAPLAEKAGDRIGHYKLLQKIGEGGCGVVYMAEQEEPVRRRVALKVIKLGMDTKSVIARFEAERQALALMDHPHIAKVLDAGATSAGRPFFVMELVRGIKISEYCDQHQLSTKSRLELFVQVCRAIQHAHLKGIIHRDIKPSNILVADHDGVPVPKIIDFGIAKATTDQRLTDKTLFTALEQFIGTPAYMSPEQANLSGLDIDTRTDIYSLGVLLYELLTGETPFDPKELLAAGLDEMRRTIREKEPVRPSTRLSTMLAADLTSVASHRQVEPERLTSTIRGDLDWIVMKALEKDRTRRYETANGMAVDIERHLKNEPVVARPQSAAYRFQKLVRRNKLAFAAAGAIALVLILGIITSTWQAGQARKAAVSEKAARHVAEESQLRESAQRVLADANARRAIESERSAQRLLYDSDINLAALAWEDGNLSRMVALLEAHQPKPDEDDLRGFEYYRLQELARGQQEYVFHGHTNPVYGVAVSPDGKWLASRSATETRLWDLPGRTFVASFASAGPPNADTIHYASGVSFSYDSQYLATVSEEGLTLCQISTRQTRTLPVGKKEMIAFSPVTNLIALTHPVMSASDPSRIHMWDYLSGREVGALGPAYGLWGWSADGARLLTDVGSPDVLWWDVRTLRSVETNRVAQWAFGLALSRDGRLLAAADWQGEIRLREMPGGKDLGTLAGSDIRSYALAFSPDGRFLATSSRDQAVLIWEVATRQKVRQLRGHRGKVNSLAYTPDGQRLVRTGSDGEVMLWNLQRPAGELEIPNQYDGFWGNGFQFSPDGKSLALGVGGGKVDMMDAVYDRSGPRRIEKSRTGEIISFSPDSGQIALVVIARRALLVIGNVGGSSNRAMVTLDVSGTIVRGPKLSPDGTMIAVHIASGRTDHTTEYKFNLCEAATGENILSVTNADVLAGDCFLPDGRTWAVSDGAKIDLWDLPTHRISRSLRCGNQANLLSVSPKGKFLAVATIDNLISLWDLDSGVELGNLAGHQAAIWSVAFSPDGRTLASGSEDRTVKFWDLVTRRELASIPQESVVYWLSFSPDNQMLVSGAIGSYHFWHAPRGGVALPATPKASLTDLPTNSVWRIPDGPRPLPRRYLAEKEECFANMLQLHKAIMAYQTDHHQMPDWLSDLAPQYLSDTNCLICPVQTRTGRSPNLLGTEDPRIKTSYFYEFNAHTNTFIDPFGMAAPGDTTKEWKTKQLAHFGGIVPVLRCQLHGDVLNVSYAGERLESGQGWEYAAEAKLRKGNPVEAGQWLARTETGGSVRALKTLAWVMAASPHAEERDGPSAVRLAERAVALTKREDGTSLDTLAAAYAETGQFDMAAGVETEALARETGAALKKDYEARLKLYQTRMPYRDPD